MSDFLLESTRPQNWLFYLFAYGLAATPTSYLVVRTIHKIDILKTPGHSHTAASIWRRYSKSSGVLVFVLDVLKGLIPCAIAYSLGTPVEVIALIGLVAVVGQCFSIWLAFSGGKGGDTALGAMLIIFWPAALAALATFLLALLLKFSAGLANIIAAAAGLLVLFLGMPNKTVWLMVALVVGIIFYRHKKYFAGAHKPR